MDRARSRSRWVSQDPSISLFQGHQGPPSTGLESYPFLSHGCSTLAGHPLNTQSHGYKDRGSRGSSQYRRIFDAACRFEDGGVQCLCDRHKEFLSLMQGGVQQSISMPRPGIDPHGSCPTHCHDQYSPMLRENIRPECHDLRTEHQHEQC